MTTTLQQLIDESVFISTEHQARLAELSQGVEWDVDFSAASFTLQSDPPVTLRPHLLGTDSTSRGSWIWAWQELGHFPPEVVAASVQARQTGSRSDVAELITDEIPREDGLARRLALAAKAVTGIWAHYPAGVGGQVTAWLLLEGAELELPPLSVETMMRVIAETLQTGTAEDHARAVDSYVRLRGAHIEWDTEATCVITTRTGAQRLWFEDRRIDAAESADPLVGEQELTELEEQAAARRQALRADRDDALRLAAEQTERDRAAREADEQARREATAAQERAEAEAPIESPVAPPLPEELSREELEAPVPSSEQPAAALDDEPAYEISHDEQEQPSVEEQPEVEPEVTYGGAAAQDDLPYDQDPRRDVAPGEVTTSTVPVAEQAAEQPREDAPEPAAVEQPAAEQEPEGSQAETVERISAEDLRRQDEPQTERTVAPASSTEAQESEDAARTEDAEQPRKKGFLSRFFGR